MHMTTMYTCIIGMTNGADICPVPGFDRSQTAVVDFNFESILHGKGCHIHLSCSTCSQLLLLYIHPLSSNADVVYRDVMPCLCGGCGI